MERIAWDGTFANSCVKLGLYRTKDVDCFGTIDGESAGDGETNTYEESVVSTRTRCTIFPDMFRIPVAPPVTATTRPLTSKRLETEMLDMTPEWMSCIRLCVL